MLANHLGENIPNLGSFALDHFLRGFDRCSQAATLEFAKDKGLEEFERHLFRQAALMQTQSRSYYDDRTTRIVDSLTEQVLTEATLLALNHIRKRLQWALVRTRDCATATAVVQKRVDSFLQHTLFVTHNNVGRIEIEQTLESVITVNDSTIEIVQVRGGETTTVEWN